MTDPVPDPVTDPVTDPVPDPVPDSRGVAEKEPGKDHSANAAISVLVCDDTAAKRYVIASWLRRDGYTVLEAETGTGALEVMAREKIDLAVLDVHLPDMSGLDVCASIKAEPSTATTPVMHISAVAVEPQDRSAGLDRGADAYMIDPIQPQEMLATVRSLLRSSVALRSAERLATRLDRLAAVSRRINVALNPLRVAAAASEGAARILATEAVVVLHEDGASSVAGRTGLDGLTKSSNISEELSAELLSALPDSSVVHAADQPWTQLLSGSFDGPWTVSALRNGKETVGLIAVPAYAEATDDDRTMLRRIADAASVALGNLRVYGEEHRTALTLQRSLLPALLPDLDGLRVAARYKASGEQIEVGGDFFDVFVTDDDRIVVVIGDVQGHSLEAAVVMAELRYSLRAFVHDGHPAVQALRRLNSLLLRGHTDLTATMCMLVLPGDRSEMEVANAGHIPPLVVRDGRAAYLEPGGTLLGIETRRDRPATVALQPGDRIVLMTDGLVERRTQSIAVGLDRLSDEVAASDATGEVLCDQLMDHWGGGEDDVCIIVLDVDPA